MDQQHPDLSMHKPTPDHLPSVPANFAPPELKPIAKQITEVLARIETSLRYANSQQPLPAIVYSQPDFPLRPDVFATLMFRQARSDTAILKDLIVQLSDALNAPPLS